MKHMRFRWTFAAALVLLATTAACAAQSDGLGGAALPQEAATGGAAAGQQAVDAGQPADSAVAPADALTDALGAAAPDAGVPIPTIRPPVIRPWSVASGSTFDALSADWQVDVTTQTRTRGPRDYVSYAADKRSTIVNGAAENIDALTAADFGRGAVIGYVYLAVPAAGKLCPPKCPDVPPNLPPLPNAAAPESDAGAAPLAATTQPALAPPRMLPAGYYAVMVTTDRTGKAGKAVFLDRDGKVQAEAPVVIGAAAKATRPSTGVALSVFQVCFTWTTSGGKTFTVCITLDNSSL